MFEKLIEVYRNFRKNHGYGCQICGKELFDYPAHRICDGCRENLPWTTDNGCPVCGRKVIGEGVCLTCKAQRPRFARGISLFSYDDLGAIAVNQFKNGKRHLAYFFAEELGKRVEEQIDAQEDTVVYYAPITEEKREERGFNQAEDLAREFCLITGYPLIEDGLEKRRETKQQKRMTAIERQENVSGAFYVKKRTACRDKRVILIDDILTTGATGNELSRILLLAGAKEVILLTIVATKEMR